MTEDKCKKCGRKIVWAKMPSGAVTPFVKVTGYELVEGQAVKYGLEIHISHYVDCQFAGEFGKNKKPLEPVPPNAIPGTRAP